MSVKLSFIIVRLALHRLEKYLTSLVFSGRGWPNPEERRELNLAATTSMLCQEKEDTFKEKGVLTTSSIMGSGLAASNWSLTLSSTANKGYLSSRACLVADNVLGARQ